MEWDGKFGRYLLGRGLVSEGALMEARSIQRRHTHLRIGEILLGLRAIEFGDFREALDAYRATCKLGELLVMDGAITENQLAEALARQPETGLMLGKVLIEMGVCSTQQVIEALAVQRREQTDPFGMQQLAIA